ncbi:MAG: electron transfer flavoprotein subunit beta/FixA family protein [Planctomycetota bacterium]
MQIAVCLKRVPDTATKVRVGADGKSIDPTDVQYVISPYDEFAIEEAIRLKEKHDGTTVTVVTVGDAAAQKDLRQALAMGADAGILIKSDESVDPYQTSKNLAKALGDRGFDLVFFGRQSVDDGSGQVGPLTARLLGIPCVTDVVAFEVDGGRATIDREVEGAVEVIDAPLPVAITAQKGLNDPRYASLKGIMQAKKKKIEELDLSGFDARLDVQSLSPPPARPDGKIVGEGVEAIPELVRLLREEAKVL